VYIAPEPLIAKALKINHPKKILKLVAAFDDKIICFFP
jgi:hypothetical protein